MAIEERFLRTGGSQCHSYLQEGQKEGSRELQASKPHLDPGKVIQQRILETISNYMKDKKVIGHSQHGYTVDNFYNDMTGAVDVIYLDFRKACITVSHNILIDKLMVYGLDQWTVRWI